MRIALGFRPRSELQAVLQLQIPLDSTPIHLPTSGRQLCSDLVGVSPFRCLLGCLPTARAPLPVPLNWHSSTTLKIVILTHTLPLQPAFKPIATRE